MRKLVKMVVLYWMMLIIVSAAPIPKIWGDDIQSMGAGKNNQVSRDKTDFQLSLFDDESTHNQYGSSDSDAPWYWGFCVAGLGLATFWCCIKTEIYKQIDFSLCSRSPEVQGGVNAQNMIAVQQVEDAADERRHNLAMDLEREKLQAALVMEKEKLRAATELEKEKLKVAQPPPYAPQMYPNLGQFFPTAPNALVYPATATATAAPVPMPGNGNVTLMVVNSADSKDGTMGRSLSTLDPDEIWPTLSKDNGKRETPGEILARGIKEALGNIN